LSYKLHISPQVHEYQTTLGPQARRSVKKAIRNLGEERGDIIALRDKLTGFYRLRIGRHRLIFRYQPARVIQCIYLNERSLVYELFEAEMARIGSWD
jgi:mRNA-degrading endonuclease RelE of RelBE toxin-antitoxin system